MASQPDLSVVFPVYNEEENIPILLAEIARALEGRGWSYEILAVDDGSRDRSLEVLRQARESHPMLRILTFAKNSGQTAALDAAWRAARGTFVVSLDADLQNDPADIPRMMSELARSGSDMVIGVRVNRHDTWSRRMQSKIGNGVRNWITRDRITDTGCSLKVVRREAIDRVKLYNGMHRFLPTLVRMQGYTVVETPVSHRARQFGVSKYGAMNRAFRGLVDCLAVRWMGRRLLHYDVREDVLTPLDPRSWHWDLLAAFGFIAQALFAMRFIIQWIASEKRRESHIPVQFWWLSLAGGVLMTIYGVLRRDPVIVLGQAPGLIVYARNLMLIHRHAQHDPA